MGRYAKQIERTAAATASGKIDRKPKTAKQQRAARKQLVNKIPRKYHLTRGVARTLLGTAHVGAVTTKGAGRMLRTGSTKAYAKATERKWTPAGRSKFECGCNRSFESMAKLNAHFVAEHFNEKPVAVRGVPQGKLVAAPSRRTPNRRLMVVAPSSVPARHKVFTSTSPERRVDALIKAYGPNIRKIGERAMTSQGVVRNIGQAARALGDERPSSMQEIREIGAGLERAAAELSDSLSAYHRWLTSESGARLSGDVTAPGFRQMTEALEVFGRGATGHVAMIEAAYSVYFRTGVAAPNLREATQARR